MDLLRSWDADSNGVVDRQEFRDAIEALGFGTIASAKDINALFNEIDTSGDGQIEFKELQKMLKSSSIVDARMQSNRVKGAAAMRSEANAKLKSKDAKSMLLDVDLQLQEDPGAAHALEKLREIVARSSELVMQLFTDIDKSGDGVIDKVEFGLAMRALGIRLSKDEQRALFRYLDPDRSGYIDYPEMREMLGT